MSAILRWGWKHLTVADVGCGYRGPSHTLCQGRAVEGARRDLHFVTDLTVHNHRKRSCDQLIMHKYERGKILGKGSFGRAVLAKNRADGKQVVIKEVSMRNMKPAEREAAKQEAQVRHG